MSHRRVANTEDRIKVREAVCRYQLCGARLRPSQVADGWEYCDEECLHAALMDRHHEDTTEDDE
jgi:hypothetical protein